MLKPSVCNKGEVKCQLPMHGIIVSTQTTVSADPERLLMSMKRYFTSSAVAAQVPESRDRATATETLAKRQLGYHDALPQGCSSS